MENNILRFGISVLAVLSCLQLNANAGVCRFFENTNQNNEYTCELRDAFLMSDGQLIISGNHIANRTDDDVVTLFTINSNLTTIDGTIMKRFRNLKRLFLTSTNVHHVTIDAVGRCEHLESLNLLSNQIRSLEPNFLRNCSRLFFLNLDRNPISFVTRSMLTGAPNLAVIGLSGTNATVFEDTFYDTTSIQILDLSNNFMLMIPTRLLENQTQLHTIDFARNRLWNFDNIKDVFGDYPRFISINLQLNYFRVIDFEFMKRFNSFQFSGNSISSIPENAFSPELRELSLNSMELSSIHENAFVGLNQLRRLTIEFNPIESVGRNIFRPLIALEILSFTVNGVSNIHPEMFVHNTNLVTLDFGSNGILELGENVFPSSLTNLETLIISSNQIYRLNSNSFGTLHNLTRIEVSNNRISEIEPGFFKNFPNLQSFHASSNECISSNLNSIDFENSQDLNMCRVNWSNRNGTTTTPSGQEKQKVFNAALIVLFTLQLFL